MKKPCKVCGRSFDKGRHVFHLPDASIIIEEWTREEVADYNGKPRGMNGPMRCARYWSLRFSSDSHKEDRLVLISRLWAAEAFCAAFAGWQADDPAERK